MLVCCSPASAETYYQAPAGPGPMIPRTDLTLPSVNSDALRSTKELINDQSPTNDQAFLGLARALNYVCVNGQCGAQEARLILSFSPKINGNPKLIFEQEFPKFHLLYPGGGPFWVGWGRQFTPGPSACQGGPCPANVTTVADEEHPTTHNLFMGILLPWPNEILSGQLMEVLIDYVPGQRNRMWVVAEKPAPPRPWRGRPRAK
jgi:hypothetical protein